MVPLTGLAIAVLVNFGAGVWWGGNISEKVDGAIKENLTQAADLETQRMRLNRIEIEGRGTSANIDAINDKIGDLKEGQEKQYDLLNSFLMSQQNRGDQQ